MLRKLGHVPVRLARARAGDPDLPDPVAFYGSLMLNSLTVRKAVPAMEKLARFYNIGVLEKN